MVRLFGLLHVVLSTATHNSGPISAYQCAADEEFIAMAPAPSTESLSFFPHYDDDDEPMNAEFFPVGLDISL